MNFTRAIIYFSSPTSGSFKIFLLEKEIYISTGIVPCIISVEITTVKSDFAFANVELRNLYSTQQQLSWGIGKNCESTMYHRGATKNYRQARPRVIFWLIGLIYERPNLTKIYLAIWKRRYCFYIEVRPQPCGSYLWRRPFYVPCTGVAARCIATSSAV